MNAGGGHTREAVENVVWMNKMPSGAYKVVVNNYAKREASDVGFVIEVECGGKLSHFSYNKTVRDKQDIHVVTLHMKEGRIENLEIGDPAVTASNISQTKWGLSTEQYVKVDAVTLSPNYWGDNAVGNKHTFFVLHGAKNDEPTRGIYNEFLHARLEPHRKVFEVIGDKTKCQPTDGQLSGLGFSSTKRTNILVKVQQGAKRRLFQRSRRFLITTPQPRHRQKDTTPCRTTSSSSPPATSSGFSSVKGELTIESLWDVPLPLARDPRDDFNLNAVAKATNKALKEISEENFVETAKTAEHTKREVALEVVKYVIDTKHAEETAAANRAAKKQEKEKLLNILAEKQAGKMSELTERELKQRIKDLED